MGVPHNGWLTEENPIKMDDFRVPPFQETSICKVVLGNHRNYGHL